MRMPVKLDHLLNQVTLQGHLELIWLSMIITVKTNKTLATPSMRVHITYS